MCTQIVAPVTHDRAQHVDTMADEATMAETAETVGAFGAAHSTRGGKDEEAAER